MRAAKLRLDMAACDAEHIVRMCVEVKEIVNAIAPGILPAIRGKQLFEDGSGIAGTAQPDR